MLRDSTQYKLPTCLHHNECPGCTDRELTYGEHLQSKQDVFLKEFKDYEPLVRQAIPAIDPLNYRYKVQLPFAKNPKTKKTELGIFKRGSHQVIDQQECHIQDTDLNKIVGAVRSWANKLHLPVFDEKKQKGLLRYLILRKTSKENQVLIGLVNYDKINWTPKLESALFEELSQNGVPKTQICGIIEDQNSTTGNTVITGNKTLLYGKSHLEEEIGGLYFELEIDTFFQINTLQIPNLYNAISNWVPEKAKLIELFSGTGSIGIWMAPKCNTVMGIERNRFSVLAANRSAQFNGFNHIKFECGDAFEVYKNKVLNTFDTCIVDPPRKGLGAPLIELLNDHPISHLIYVSCNPKTLLTDLKKLESSYNIEALQTVDMFPFTSHLETIVLLKPTKTS